MTSFLTAGWLLEKLNHRQSNRPAWLIFPRARTQFKCVVAATASVGDRVLEVDGQPCNGMNMQGLCRGVPETIVNVVILRRGEVLHFSVPRTDSRLLSNEDGYFASQARRTRFW